MLPIYKTPTNDYERLVNVCRLEADIHVTVY